MNLSSTHTPQETPLGFENGQKTINLLQVLKHDSHLPSDTLWEAVLESTLNYTAASLLSAALRLQEIL